MKPHIKFYLFSRKQPARLKQNYQVKAWERNQSFGEGLTYRCQTPENLLRRPKY